MLPIVKNGAVGRRFSWSDVDTISHARAVYRGGGGAIYDYDLSSGLHPLSVTEGGEPYTAPVASLPPNGYGLYDMTGNISEWCWDYMHTGYYAFSPSVDPRGPTSSNFGGEMRVIRGGHYGDSAWDSRVLSTPAARRIGP